MIEAKTFEIRDDGTFIPVVAVRIAPYEQPDHSADRYLMRRAGYGDPLVLMTNLSGDGCPTYYDPFSWANRTRNVAHAHITEHWAELPSGSVIDVEFILGLRDAPKISEREECPL